MGVSSIGKDGIFSAKSVVFSSRTGIKKDYPLGPNEPEKEAVEESDITVEQPVDIEPEEIGRLGGATGEETTLRKLRRDVGRRVIRAIHVNRKGEGKYPEGEIRVAYDRGNVEYVGFCSLGVLAQALRQWRNLQGATLFVDNKPAGKISYQNPVLTELSRW